MAMVSALTLLMTAGAVSINSGIAGFANSGVLTVVALFPLAAGVTHTGEWEKNCSIHTSHRLFTNHFQSRSFVVCLTIL